MKEKILGFFTGIVDTVIRIAMKVVSVGEALLDTLVNLSKNPRQFLWVVIGIIVAWDVLKGGAFGSINFLLNAALDLSTKAVALVTQGGWQLVAMAFAAWLIADVIQRKK